LFVGLPGYVGVFAIKNIKKDTKVFGGDNIGMVWIEEKLVARLPKENYGEAHLIPPFRHATGSASRTRIGHLQDIKPGLAAESRQRSMRAKLLNC
jgi:hypothetical protein